MLFSCTSQPKTQRNVSQQQIATNASSKCDEALWGTKLDVEIMLSGNF